MNLAPATPLRCAAPPALRCVAGPRFPYRGPYTLSPAPGGGALELWREGRRLLRAPTRLELLVTAEGCVWQARLTLELAGEHLYGTGERYTSPDQAGRRVVFSSFERFTFQGSAATCPSRCLHGTGCGGAARGRRGIHRGI